MTASPPLIDTRRTWIVRLAERDDLDAMTRLAGARFDARYKDDPEAIRDWLPGADLYEYNKAFVAECPADDRIVGFSMGTLTQAGDWLQDLTYLTDEQLDEWAAPRMGYFFLSCVDKAWTGRGIGTSLFRARYDWFREENATQLLGLSWLRPEAPDSSALFEAFGFQRVCEHDDAYRHDGRICPDCGTPCDCRAAVYGRAVA